MYINIYVVGGRRPFFGHVISLRLSVSNKAGQWCLFYSIAIMAPNCDKPNMIAMGHLENSSTLLPIFLLGIMTRFAYSLPEENAFTEHDWQERCTWIEGDVILCDWVLKLRSIMGFFERISTLRGQLNEGNCFQRSFKVFRDAREILRYSQG